MVICCAAHALRGWTAFNRQSQLPLILMLILAGIMSASADAAPLLWNRLGSTQQIQNSGYGPGLGFFGGGAWPDVVGNPGYVPGVFGEALTVAPGGYGTFDRVHTVVWENLNQHLNPHRGTIEVWHRQVEDPVPFSHGVYRIFDGSYGLGSGMTFTSEYVQGQSKALLLFGLEFGGSYTLLQHDISPHNGNWIHLAGVWARDGIDGSADKLRLYVNGNVVAATTVAAWGSTVGPRAGIGGGNDASIANKFALDNLKVFDSALTDFSHRFDESWIPEPAGLSLIGLALLGGRRRRQ
jgi:hypothetical protein